MLRIILSAAIFASALVSVQPVYATTLQEALTKLGNMEKCAMVGKLYAPNAFGADSDGCKSTFDPKDLTIATGDINLNTISCGAEANRCGSDDKTLRHICNTNGYTSPLNFTSGRYKNPAERKLGRWNDFEWEIISAADDNRPLLTLSCIAITAK